MPEHTKISLSDGAPAPAADGATVTGTGYRISLLTDRLIRVEWDPQERFADEKTQQVMNRTFPVPAFRVARTLRDQFARAKSL